MEEVTQQASSDGDQQALPRPLLPTLHIEAKFRASFHQDLSPHAVSVTQWDPMYPLVEFVYQHKWVHRLVLQIAGGVDSTLYPTDGRSSVKKVPKGELSLASIQLKDILEKNPMTQGGGRKWHCGLYLKANQGYPIVSVTPELTRSGYTGG